MVRKILVGLGAAVLAGAGQPHLQAESAAVAGAGGRPAGASREGSALRGRVDETARRASASPPRFASAGGATPAADGRALLDRYCVACHNRRTLTAGLALDTLDLSRVSADAAVWEHVVRRLRAGEMPPAGRPRPDADAAHGFVSWLEGELDRAALAAPDPGRSAVHRLNRAEYANAVRDLFGLEIDARSLLPPTTSTTGSTTSPRCSRSRRPSSTAI